MKPELGPREVAARLAELKARYLPERVEDAIRRLERERPPADEPFERAVARSLAELRALCELARHLRIARSMRGPS